MIGHAYGPGLKPWVTNSVMPTAFFIGGGFVSPGLKPWVRQSVMPTEFI